MCCLFDIHLLNGRLYDDFDGNFTCVTARGTSVVDYHAVSSDLFKSVQYFKIDDHDESDHFPVHSRLIFTHTDDNQQSCNSGFIENEKYSVFEKYRWDDRYRVQFLERFRELLENLHVDTNFSICTIDEAISQLVNVYKSAAGLMKVNGRSKRQNFSQPDWWDNDCKISKRTKFAKLRTFRNSGRLEDLEKYKLEKRKFKNLTNAKKLKHQRKKRQALIASRNNPKSFWKIIKENSTSKSIQTKLVQPGSWVNHFETLLCKGDQPSIFDLDLNGFPNETNDDFLNKPITQDEIENSIKCLKIGKSHGLDGIGAEFYRNTSSLITPYLLTLFNNILNTGQFPAMWCESIIVPIYKSGAKDNPSNYRGISLINTMYKIFSIILNRRIYDWVEMNGILDESQSGFRAGYSGIDNIFSLQSMVQKYLSKTGGRFYVL